MYKNLVLCIADLVHRSSEKVTVSVAEVKRLVPYLHSKDQVGLMYGLYACTHASCTPNMLKCRSSCILMVGFQFCSLNKSRVSNGPGLSVCIQQAHKTYARAAHGTYARAAQTLHLAHTSSWFHNDFTFHTVLQQKFCLVPNLPFTFLLPPPWLAGTHHI